MLPDLSGSHIIILVVAALIVIGPKDLPSFLRKVGQFMGKLRGMANEFRSSFDEMARQSELDDLRKEVEAMRAAAGQPISDLRNATSEFEGHLMQPLISTTSSEHAALDATADVAPLAESEAAPAKRTATKAKSVAKTKSTAKSKAPAKAKSDAKPKATPTKAPVKKTPIKKVKAKTPAEPGA